MSMKIRIVFTNKFVRIGSQTKITIINYSMIKCVQKIVLA